MRIQVAQVIETEIGYTQSQDEDTGNNLFPGAIKFRLSGQGQDHTIEDYAHPIDVNNFKKPLVGEKVILYLAPNDQRTSFRKKDRYLYGQIINIHDNLNTNVLPFESVQMGSESPGADPAGGIQGATISDTATVEQIDHEENDVVPLQPYDGDMLMQDRYGNALRFTKTTAGGPYKTTLLLASNQILDITTSQPKFGTPIKPIIPPSTFNGAQVLINSDRLVFNSKADSILLSSASTVAISTPAWSVDMDEFFTLFDNLLTTLQKVFAGTSVFPTPVGGPTLPNPTALAELVQIITKYKQMTQ